MITRAKKLLASAAAAVTVPAMLATAGVAHASMLTLYPVTHIGGVWVGWDGGSGGTWCTYTSDWFSMRAPQNAAGQGGVFIPGIPQNRSWDLNVTCDNGDWGFRDNYYY